MFVIAGFSGLLIRYLYIVEKTILFLTFEGLVIIIIYLYLYSIFLVTGILRIVMRFQTNSLSLSNNL